MLQEIIDFLRLKPLNPLHMPSRVILALALTAALVMLPVAPARATLQQDYLNIYLEINDAQHLQQQGDFIGALKQFRGLLPQARQDPREQSRLGIGPRRASHGRLPEDDRRPQAQGRCPGRRPHRRPASRTAAAPCARPGSGPRHQHGRGQSRAGPRSRQRDRGSQGPQAPARRREGRTPHYERAP